MPVTMHHAGLLGLLSLLTLGALYGVSATPRTDGFITSFSYSAAVGILP